ncbi:transposase, partial [Bhargavaea beijingensis]|uniref:transposase n=1 Tax=Bhargavaea beijingensis TaxID=426756 RepID=UPI0021ADF007
MTPGNVHDSHIFEPLLNVVKEKVGKPLAVAADAGYKTPHIAKVMIDDGIR